MGSVGIISPLQSTVPAMPDGQPWHHFTPAIYGTSHARMAVALDGLDDDVAAGVHHERFLPPLPLDTGQACAFAEGDDTDDVEGVLQACAEADDAEGVHHALALVRGGGAMRVLEDTDGVGVVLDLAAAMDSSRATLDTALVRALRKH